MRCGVVCLSVYWHYMMAFYNVVWFGVVWCGLVCPSVYWHYMMAFYNAAWFGVVWCGLVWCGVPVGLLTLNNGIL